MIKAEHKKWARLIFNLYIDKLLKNNFVNYYLLNSYPVLDKNLSVVLTPNHISWWDGFFIDYIVKIFSDRKMHIMMLEEQLKKFWFFQKLGAYSVNPDNVGSLLTTVRYTRKLLNNPESLAVIYPQGKIEPFEKRPLTIKNGLKLFVENMPNEIAVIPVAFKIQYFNEKKPAVIARFGKILYAETICSDYQLYVNEFYRNLDELNKAVFDNKFQQDLFR
ncbi:MAG: lysophospholipid acyltransferase family protein [Ignavibacteriaceae bacterium]